MKISSVPTWLPLKEKWKESGKNPKNLPRFQKPASSGWRRRCRCQQRCFWWRWIHDYRWTDENYHYQSSRERKNNSLVYVNLMRICIRKVQQSFISHTSIYQSMQIWEGSHHLHLANTWTKSKNLIVWQSYAGIYGNQHDMQSCHWIWKLRFSDACSRIVTGIG